MTWTDAVGIPPEQIHTVGDGTPDEEAAAYAAMIEALPEEVMARTSCVTLNPKGPKP